MSRTNTALVSGFTALLALWMSGVGLAAQARAGTVEKLRSAANQALRTSRGSKATPSHKALSRAAALYARAHELSRQDADLDTALRLFVDAAASAPRGRAAAPLLSRGRLLMERRADKREAHLALTELVRRHPRTKEARVARRLLRLLKAFAPERPARSVVGLRQESGPDSARLVIELDGGLRRVPAPLASTDWRYVRLRLPRIRAAKKWLTHRDSASGLVRRYGLRKWRGGLILDVRVDNPVRARVFHLERPQRLVLDLGRSPMEPPVQAALAEPPTPLAPRALRSVLRRVVIDPGHGGRDPGALGSRTRLREKDVTLRIARRLAALLKRVGVEVWLTRDGDETVDLRSRPALANEKNADLFVSIHVNSNPNAKRRGLETYYLDSTRDAYAQHIADRENRAGGRAVSELDFILGDLQQRTNVRASMRLAGEVLRATVQHLQSRFDDVVGHGAKPAMFDVLVGAKMPAILVETSYLTHAGDEKRLRQPAYLQRVAEGLFLGLRRWARGVSVATLDPP